MRSGQVRLGNQTESHLNIATKCPLKQKNTAKKRIDLVPGLILTSYSRPSKDCGAPVLRVNIRLLYFYIHLRILYLIPRRKMEKHRLATIDASREAERVKNETRMQGRRANEMCVHMWLYCGDIFIYSI